ncbi:MAG: bifunctional glutamate N-acetyltransferase/amino-acid acetyltransferase ArgJ [Mycobacteriales bacterium]
MSITAPIGFRATGIAAGIKPGGALDLALLVNDGPHQYAAGVFTQNKMKAAPVLWSRRALGDGKLHAVVLNSGCANACSGAQGAETTAITAERAAAALDCHPDDVAICSTGLIGSQLPREAVIKGVDVATAMLAATSEAGTAAATAVLTTDSRPKQAVRVADSGWRAGGFAKGSGMLAPSMATMLATLTVDAMVRPADLYTALRAATGLTFDRLDVDGCTSTNDTVLVLASGASGIPADLAELTAVLTELCDDLVGQLQADAEGATKHVTVEVLGAATLDDALAVGHTVARDSLVKTALFGSDANWGRVAMAVGNAEAAIDPERVEIALNGVVLCKDGEAIDGQAVDLSGRNISVTVNLHLGDGAVEIRTTDLSHAYVESNSAYSS